MKISQINHFIRKFGGNDINFYIDNKKDKFLAAETYYFGRDKKTNKSIYIIVLQKDIFCRKHYDRLYNAYLKSMLLHEIGHIKKKHFHRRIDKPTAEFEAQMWAFRKAKEFNLKLVSCYIIYILLSWSNFKYNKKLYFYYNAYRKIFKFFNKKDINTWRFLLKQIKK